MTNQSLFENRAQYQPTKEYIPDAVLCSPPATVAPKFDAVLWTPPTTEVILKDPNISFVKMINNIFGQEHHKNIPKFYEGLLSMGRVFITTACFVIVVYVSNLNCKNYLPAKTQDQLTHKGSRGPRTGVFGKFTHKTFFRRCLRRFWSFFLWLVWLHCSLVGWYCFRCLFALIYLLSSIIPPDSTCKKRTCWSSDRAVVVVVVVVDSRDVRTTWRLRPFLA